MTHNIPTENHEDNSEPHSENEVWELTVYEPYHLPAEPPYHVPPEPQEDGDGTEGWVLTIYEPYCLPFERNGS